MELGFKEQLAADAEARKKWLASLKVGDEVCILSRLWSTGGNYRHVVDNITKTEVRVRPQNALSVDPVCIRRFNKANGEEKGKGHQSMSLATKIEPITQKIIDEQRKIRKENATYKLLAELSKQGVLKGLGEKQLDEILNVFGRVLGADRGQ